MSYKKFNSNDVVVNTMRTHPKSEFLIYDGRVYYNDTPQMSGSFTDNTLGVPPGHISLYENNIDRVTGSNNLSFPFILKSSAGANLKTVSSTAYSNGFVYGDQMSDTYPMSASITRELMTSPATRATGIDKDTGTSFDTSPLYRHFYSLKNRLDFYGIRSQHYKVSSSYGDKNSQTLNLISIPSIFYGSKIKKGTVSMKWYFTGSLIGELEDVKQNGELIQVGPTGSAGSGSVAGVILYDEGFVILTGSWDLNDETIPLIANETTAVKPSWLYYGAGALDGVTQASTAAAGNTSDYMSASFNFSFSGHSETQVLTMFAHAPRGEVNYSNNPTYAKYGQKQVANSSSQVYEENPNREIVNMASSSWSEHSASFERQVYISRVGIYDENKNLIGVATLSNPVLKKEDQGLTFKLRIDI